MAEFILENIKEDVNNAKPISKILNGYGVVHTIDNSYIVLASFLINGVKQKYYVSGPSLEYVLSKVNKYKNNEEFSAKAYHLLGGNAIPLLYNSNENLNSW